jgi:hypothetical protein
LSLWHVVHWHVDKEVPPIERKARLESFSRAIKSDLRIVSDAPTIIVLLYQNFRESLRLFAKRFAVALRPSRTAHWSDSVVDSKSECAQRGFNFHTRRGV